MPLRPDVLALPAGDPNAELVFPSGRRCHGLDELVQACQHEWDDACGMLERGDLGRYLDRLGRADLARDVKEAQEHPDRDVGLYNFLNQLPASRAQGPRLDLSPRRIVLKQFPVGAQHQLHLTVANEGKGLLQGRLAVSDGREWIKLAGPDEGRVGIKTNRDQKVVLGIDTRMLVGGQTYSGRLTVITNGGIAEVPVRLDLQAVPFPHPPYKGAGTPRELAQRMLKNPKPAVPLLENGTVAQWFAANGWNYPVSGDTARGIGAVQQFFECLGLSKPPPLQLSDYELRLECVAPQSVGGQVTLRTPSRKWVYGQVDCDAPWVRILTPSVSGAQQAVIGFEVDSGPLDGDQMHQALVKIRANGNQKLSLRLKVDVQQPKESAAGRLLRPVLAVALLALLLRLLLFFPGDLFARLLTGRPEPVPKGSLAFWASLPGAEDAFLPHFVLATWWLGGLAGLVLVWRRGGRWTDIVCGVVAGSAAGLALFSVLGCLLILFDGLPRALLAGLGRLTGLDLGAGAATSLWLVLAVGCWALLGGCAGLLLAALGPRGLRVLTGLLRGCGLARLAGWLTPRG
jgi:hypothetical protein